jgi:flagellar basal body-associated protein FliL
MTKKKIIIIILVGLLLIITSITTTIAYLNYRQKQTIQIQKEKNKKVSIKLFTFVTTIQNNNDKIVDDNEINTNSLQITMYAEIDQKNKEWFKNQVEKYKPEFKNNILQTIALFNAQELLKENGKNQLAQKITDTINKTIVKENQNKKNIVQKILFTSFIIQ